MASKTMLKDLPEPVVCPDHPAGPRAVPVLAVHPLNESFHAKELLIAGRDLAIFLIEQNKQAHKLQQPVGPQQADKQPVLPAR